MHTHERRAEMLRLAQRTTAFEPTSAQRAAWQASVDGIVGGYIDKLSDQNAFSSNASEALAVFSSEMEHATELPEIMAALHKGIASAGLQAASPGHLAFVPGGGLYAGAVADHFAAALNGFSADAFSAPVSVRVHEETVRWLTQVVGYGDEAWGDITSGGSMATLTAFYVARQSRGVKPRDYHKTCVYLSEHTHHCCEKALKILFDDELCLRKVPQLGHIMDTAKLQEMIAVDRDAGLRPWMIIATAGSTNLGRVDDIATIATLSREQDLWLHVDGAYGGLFHLCPSVRGKFAGIEAADSVVLDPHKGLFLPYGCGAVVFKRGEQLRASLSHTGTYLQDRSSDLQKSPMDYSFELTRPFRSLRIWLALKVYGQQMFADALQEKLLLSAHCREQLASLKHIALVGSLDLSIFAFRFEHPAAPDGDLATKQLLQAINANGASFLSSTVVDGRFVIRVAILSFRTHLATIDALIETIRRQVQVLSDRLHEERS